MGARPWVLERRNVLARGNYNRLIADGRNTERQILAEAQWRLKTAISANGFSAFKPVFWSNLLDLHGCDDRDEDLLIRAGLIR